MMIIPACPTSSMNRSHGSSSHSASSRRFDSGEVTLDNFLNGSQKKIHLEMSSMGVSSIVINGQHYSTHGQSVGSYKKSAMCRYYFGPEFGEGFVDVQYVGDGEIKSVKLLTQKKYVKMI